MKEKYPMPEGKASYKESDAKRGFVEVSKKRETNDDDQRVNNNRGKTLEEMIADYLS